MGLRDFLQDLLCKPGIHNWDGPERSDVTSGLKVSRICRNCRKIEGPSE